MLTTQEALVSLTTSAATAAVDALRAFAPDDAGLGPVSVTLPGRDPLAGADVPAVIAGVSYAEGGGAVFMMPLAIARRLAAAVHGDAGPAGAGELSAVEADALGQAAGRVMEAVTAATGAALDLEVGTGALEVRTAHSARDVKIGFQGATRATLAVVSLYGETCRLVQLVPSGFVMRIAQDDGAEHPDAAARGALDATLRAVPLRVWAEVGRARLRSAEVASLSDGAIVELDRAAEDPVDLYVNGSRIATGRLVCIDGKEWAVRLEEVFPAAEADTAAA